MVYEQVINTYEVFAVAIGNEQLDVKERVLQVGGSGMKGAAWKSFEELFKPWGGTLIESTCV